MGKLLFISISAFCLVALLLVPQSAQTYQTGDIRGKVRAKDGPEITGVTVTAREERTGRPYNTTTNDSGDFQINHLPVGAYTVTFEKDGFQKGKKGHVIVEANRTTECDHLEMVFYISTGNLTGRELLNLSRVGQGGSCFAKLQYLTARSSGFVNVAAVASPGVPTVTGMTDLLLNVTDYQDRDLRRRLNIAPAGGIAAGPTFLVYTGLEGGGMYSGNPFRVSEVTASRQWALMGFATLNRAIDGSLITVRHRDETNDYVVEVKFSASDTIHFWINNKTLLTSKVQTRYNSQVMVEEERSDYRHVGCMILPFHIVTKVRGQRMADLTIDSYDLQTAVPAATFTITAGN